MTADPITEEELQARIAALPPEKRVLFEQLRAERPRPDVHDLSLTQQGLWFHDRIAPGTSLYTVAWRCELLGSLRYDMFADAVNAVVARHESLRTRFGLEHGRPVQIVQPSLDIPVPVTDLLGVPEADRDEELAARIQAYTDVGFDLSDGPLLRTVLFHLAPHRHVLLLMAHHIVFDYVSCDNFLAELMCGYEGKVAGREVVLPQLTLQYGDFADWQHENLRGARRDGLVDYWSRQLASSGGVLDLPSDRPRPANKTFRGASFRFRVPADVIDPLRALARKERATLFMVYLAAFQLLMQRYSGVAAINVGVAVDNRRRAELRPLIGYFINAVVVHSDLSGNPSFRELLDRVRRSCVEAYEHQDLPFDQVVEAVAPTRSLSYNPLFQVTCALDEETSVGLSGGGLTITSIDGLHTGRAKFDLSFGGVISNGEAIVGVDYSLDLFDEDTIAGMSRHFVALLTAIGADARQPISTLPLLDDTEAGRITTQWSVGPAQAPAIPLAAAAVRHAAAQPDAVAVASGARSLTYGALLARASNLAERLRRLGVGPQTVVGLDLPRGVELVVAVLAVTSIGAAATTTGPPALESGAGGLDALITSATVRGDGDYGVPVLAVDDQDDHDGEDGHAVLSQRDWGDHPAHLPLTTDGPRRTVVTHRALTAATAAGVTQLGLTPDDRVAHLSAHGTVDAVWEICVALHAGATICVVETRSEPTIAVALKRAAVTAANLPPTIARQLPEDLLADLRVAVTAGEPFAGARARRWHDSPGRLLRGYGAAATCGIVSWTDQPPDDSGEALIGRPGPGSTLYVLDPELRPQPPGVPGELYVGGAQLAIGYHGEPGLTAQRFIPNPFAAEPGARLFRTGDLARWRADGTLTYVGRVTDRRDAHLGDRHRIPYPRVEAALTEHPAVIDAVVTTYRPRRGESLLTAYLVPAGTTPVELRDIQAFLADRLPDYMIPRAVVELDRLPVGVTGRVDQSALPPPETAVAGPSSVWVGPRSATERVLVRVWTELLDVDDVGAEDNFFDLGGHSLLAVQILAQISELFGVELEMSLLFQASTPAAMAAELAGRVGGPDEAEEIATAVEAVLDLSDDEVDQRLVELDGAAGEPRATTGLPGPGTKGTSAS